MNWRNPFLNAYLGVTVVGAGILGYLVYSSYSHYAEVSETYDARVADLQKLQNRTPYPSAENNEAFAALTSQYRKEYDKLLAQVGRMQKPIESITPQAFQDRLRTYVSEVTAAAKENGVVLSDGFYLGFDQYRDTLPSNEAAGVLARELGAIRLIVDRLVGFKVREIVGIKRELLPEEGRAAAVATPPPSGPGRRPPQGGGASEAPKIVNANTFEIVFVADQSRLRQSLNAIATADQFFIIRNLNIVNSNLAGPKRVDEAAAGAEATPPPDGTATAASAAPNMRLLVGRETLTAALRIEMITFTTPSATK